MSGIKSEIWPVDTTKLDSFQELAKSHLLRIIIRGDIQPGNYYATGSAEAELQEGQTAVEVEYKDQNFYTDFATAAAALLFPLED